jgi:hypothetical protein
MNFIWTQSSKMAVLPSASNSSTVSFSSDPSAAVSLAPSSKMVAVPTFRVLMTNGILGSIAADFLPGYRG